MLNMIRNSFRFNSIDLKLLMQLKNFSLISVQRSLPSNLESIQSSHSLRLTTAFYGVGKEIFFNESRASMNKKKFTFGDDSWFIASQKTADFLGIADGVGGWRDLGVDPSKFSSSLMQQCKRIVEQESNQFSDSNNITKNSPLNILTSSYASLVESKNADLVGSSTACVCVFNRESKHLHSANLGDSGFVVIRNNKIVHRSRETLHYFNAPFQLAILPRQRNEENLFNDSPQSAAIDSFEMEEGDFIILGTDGLWDNINDATLLMNVSKIKSSLQADLDEAVKNIVTKTVELAKDSDYDSPFAISARKNGYDDFTGGKPDDITVVLARVTK